MGCLTREGVKSVDDLKREKVAVPEWAPEGTDPAEAFIYVRPMSGFERDSFEIGCMDVRGQVLPPLERMQNLRARLAVRCICDESGNRLFTDEDAEWVGTKSVAALDRIQEAAGRLSRISKADVEALAKNSETASGTAS